MSRIPVEGALALAGSTHHVPPMGKVRRGGYVIFWWKGDHEPRHVHVKTAGGRKLGRVDVATLRGLEGWTPERKLVSILESLKREGRR